MEFSTYIIHSKSINKHYVGSTSMLVAERIKRHNYNHSGYTGQADDWTLIYEQQFKSVQESRLFEKKIKKRGAKKVSRQPLAHHAYRVRAGGSSRPDIKAHPLLV